MAEKRPVFIPYARSSKSCKAMARHFGTLRAFPDRKYRPRQQDIVVNWGYNHEIPVLKGRDTVVLNKPENIRKASSKIDCLNILDKSGVAVPAFATSSAEAQKLFKNVNTVYCRTLTRASKGKGIVIATKPSELVKAPLYTAKLNTDIEYRVHVFAGEVIDIVQKRRMTTERLEAKGIKERNPLVRNLMNGWSFTRADLTLKDKDGDYYHQLIDISLDATKTLGIDFCAIDLIKTKNDDFYVLEVNTAPGMEAGTTTHRRYVKALAKYCNIPFSDDGYTKRYDMGDNHNGNLTSFLNSYTDDEK
jgi:hypothetical protein